jgi:hypothetical protein
LSRSSNSSLNEEVIGGVSDDSDCSDKVPWKWMIGAHRTILHNTDSDVNIWSEIIFSVNDSAGTN